MGYLLPMVRAMMINNALCVFIPSALWIASIHVAAIAIDLFGSVVVIFLIRWSYLISVDFKERMGKLFEFYPAVNIEHKSTCDPNTPKNQLTYKKPREPTLLSLLCLATLLYRYYIRTRQSLE